MNEQQRQRVHRAIVRLADGDREAFGCVFEELWPAFLSFARRAMPGDPNAEDLAQQALLKVFSRISEFETDRDGVAWAFGIAANEVRTQRKRLQRRREVGDALDSLPDRARSPEQVVLDEDLNRALNVVLGQLSASDRAVLAPDGEQPTSGPIGTAGRKRRQRALDRLRALWSRFYA
jgi:RNA polymerase sigma-70 factor, ECF subfamily